MKVFCTYLCDYKDRGDYYMSLMPVGITSIAAYLESRGHEAVLANLSEAGYKKGAELTASENPDAVAVSIFSYNRTDSFRYIKELKKLRPHTVIIAGGHHATFLSEEILKRYPEIDYIVKGEGEDETLSIIENPGKPDKIKDGCRIEDLDSVPYPSAFSGKTINVNPNEQFRYIITTRGCPSSCTYCSSPGFWGRKVTYRSPENIISELRHIQNKYGIIYFSIRDDNFTLNKKRVLEFCSLLQKSGLYFMWNCQARVDTIDLEMLCEMKKSGLEHIQFGVESGSEKILKLYDKSVTVEKIEQAAALTRKAGVYLSFYLMAGMDGETKDDIKQTRSLLKRALPHDSTVSPVAYYPGTGIYEEGRRQGKIDDTTWFKSKENGLYVKKLQKTMPVIEDLLETNESLSDKSRYRKDDFKLHRKTAGEDCWMTDIMEGDHCFEEGDFPKAAALYRKVTERYPENIWGHLRLAEARDEAADAIADLKRASEIVPSYYGVWSRLAEIELEAAMTDNARKHASRARSLNPFDPDVEEIIKLLK